MINISMANIINGCKFITCDEHRVTYNNISSTNGVVTRTYLTKAMKLLGVSFIFDVRFILYGFFS